MNVGDIIKVTTPNNIRINARVLHVARFIENNYSLNIAICYAQNRLFIASSNSIFGHAIETEPQYIAIIVEYCVILEFD